MPSAKSRKVRGTRKSILPLDIDDARDGWRFIATLAALRDRASSLGVPFLDALAADQLAQLAIQALAGVRPALDEVKRIEAFRLGAEGPDSDALAILDLARLVGIFVYQRKHRDDPAWTIRGKGLLATLGREAPTHLRECLVAKHGEGVSSVEELTDWLDRHADKGARGKLTTAGIVARIVHRGRLLGARGAEVKTLQRVDKILKRHGASALVRERYGAVGGAVRER